LVDPLLLLTGFEPFVDVPENPSGLVAERLIAAPPAGVRLTGGVLPVSIERAPAALDALLAAAPDPPAAIVSLGVHRGAWFRLERRARAALRSPKRDNDGRSADGVTLAGAVELVTGLDVARLAAALRAGGAVDVRVSADAGGFVCERIYHHALTRAAERGIAAVFLHVPSVEAVGVAEQAAAVAAMLAWVGRESVRTVPGTLRTDSAAERPGYMGTSRPSSAPGA
jgi:pyroglutamyl-peptidase